MLRLGTISTHHLGFVPDFVADYQWMLDLNVQVANDIHHSNYLELVTRIIPVSQVVLHSGTTCRHHLHLAPNLKADNELKKLKKVVLEDSAIHHSS